MFILILRFYWKKNDVFFRNISVESSNGALIIESPAVTDEGIYQCFANNGFGVAVSNKAVLKMAGVYLRIVLFLPTQLNCAFQGRTC